MNHLTLLIPGNTSPDASWLCKGPYHSPTRATLHRAANPKNSSGLVIFLMGNLGSGGNSGTVVHDARPHPEMMKMVAPHPLWHIKGRFTKTPHVDYRWAGTAHEAGKEGNVGVNPGYRTNVIFQGGCLVFWAILLYNND
jgi:hypothetical protein